MISLHKFKTLLSGVASVALVAGLVFTPVGIDLEDGQLVFKTSSAYAKGNNDDNDDDDDDDDDDEDTRPLDLSVFLNSLSNGSSIVKAEVENGDIEVVYSDGWKEEIENGTYELKDPAGNTIISRPANSKDIERLSSIF